MVSDVGSDSGTVVGTTNPLIQDVRKEKNHLFLALKPESVHDLSQFVEKSEAPLLSLSAQHFCV